MGSYKIGMFFSRKFKVSEAQPPADVKQAFEKFVPDGQTLMTPHHLLQFLITSQNESEATITDAEKIVDQVLKQRHHVAKFTRHALTLDDFHHFLFSQDLNPPIKSQVHQDMNAPLSHYYIYTGHNSYLTGNQLSSDSSDVPIIKALTRGVRVIELDIWPNSDEDDVHVFHGRTLTTPVELIKCLMSIKEYAFVASPYPVVITLEDHLTPDLQAKVAEMVTKTFGEMLYHPESGYLEEFPSPESLKYRVLLSTKPPKEYLEAKDSKDKGVVSPEEEGWDKESDSDQGENDVGDEDSDDSDHNPQQSEPPEYKQLIAIHAKKHKGELEESLKVDIHKVGRLSLNEQALEKAAESHATDLVRFTQRNFLRIYPKGTRITSSNYNPLIGWMHGAQMVAFNMQGYGRSLWLMQGMFRSNGGCGYVKKPDFLIKEYQQNQSFNITENLPVKKTLKVRVYMGDGWRLDFSQTHFDSYSPPDFYAKVSIAGVPADIKKKKTKILEDNWTPVWDEEFLFPLTVPELALLRIEVHEYDKSEKDDFGGQTCFSVPELRPGIRTVPLLICFCVFELKTMTSKLTYRVCFCFQRRFKVTVAEAPSEIKTLFDSYSENGIMAVDHLQKFLVEYQGEEKTTKEEAQGIIDSLKEFKHLNPFHKKGLNLDAFFRYLFCDLNPPLSPTLGVHHDMAAPMSQYFIYTGHNSYLTGNQLSSDSSDIPIIKSLQRGVRGIELDMWPNSTKDDVDILHGRTLTTPVELMKCLRSIKEHAFSASPYPVVVTLEDHLTPDLQAKVAKMISQAFGDMLFYPGSECLGELPSPDSLKKRIIISTKPPKEYKETKSLKEKENGSQKDKKSTEEEAWGRELSELKSDFGSHDKHNDHDGEDEHQDEEYIDDGERKSQQNAEPEYKHLIGIHAGKSKGGLKEVLRVDPDKVRRISLDEQALEKAIINHATDVVRFTQRNLLRVYPKSTRVDSSNYNPLIGWMHGAQMVAFNMQGYGRSLWLMHGMFRANGGCGYVKKPEFLLKVGPNNQVFDPRVSLPVKKTLKVRVFMGDGWYLDFRHTHFDVYSPPDFYTRVGIAGVPADSVMKKTKTIEDDWTPVWDEEFEFSLTVPELALLRIEVHEYDMSEKDDFGGQTCLPISELRTGIRAVPLFTRKGEQYKSVKLLMRFEFV
ncbi:hypothetical protein IFM89_025929 [Coptis chinensis]|uniref:Phosphoinositide phospholipase C n=1 Tax=Coptis chinensis TaxID=261450 RepID=A0A835HBI0_9MAGN|nr:hypothetical protein IFM89_025929 [Coptis chinensis]